MKMISTYACNRKNINFKYKFINLSLFIVKTFTIFKNYKDKEIIKK